MNKFRTDIMRPIVSNEDFDVLCAAGLITFDHGMSEGNRYMFNIPELVRLASRSDTVSTDYELLVDTILNELSSEIYIPTHGDELKRLFADIRVTFTPKRR